MKRKKPVASTRIPQKKITDISQVPASGGQEVAVDILEKTNEDILKRNIRIIVIGLFFIVSLLYLSSRIAVIKMAYGSEYEERAIKQLIESNTESDQVIEPNRGSILDRNGNTLATSYIVHTLFLDMRKIITPIIGDTPEKIANATEKQAGDIEKIKQMLLDILGLDAARVNGYFEVDEEGKPVHDTNYLVVEKKIKRVDGIRIEERMREDEINHVYLEDESIRVYPQNNVAAQVIGFIRGDTKLGLESTYNTELSGRPGRVFRAYSERGAVITNRISPVEGHTLVTTLDLQLQEGAEAIAKQYGDDFLAEETGVIIMNPQTGEILAMAEYPTFNLNEPMNPLYLSNEDLHFWQDLEDDILIENMNRVWNNSNTSHSFEPGSIFKPATVAMALEEGIISVNDRYFCGGKKVVAGWDIHCSRRSGHGDISLTEALAMSCNVAMMDMAQLIGRDIFYEYQTNFGFGEKTGIDLPFEAETKNLLYQPADLNATELATSSFGQSFNSTPMQNIMSFNAAINGGNLIEPYLVSQVTNEKKELLREHTGVIKRKVISEKTSNYIKEALTQTLTDQGTGRRAQIPGYTIGGKTGTAQQGVRSKKEYSLSFMSYFPADTPEYSVLVYSYKPGFPIEQLSITEMGKAVMEYIIDYAKVKPDDYAESLITEGMVELVDLAGETLENAINYCQGNGLEYEIIGESGGMISGHFPKASMSVEVGTKVFLHIVEDAQIELVEIPELVGMEINQAKELLTALDIPYIEKEVLEIESSISENPLRKILVAEQMPAGGKQIQKNVAVIIQPGIME